MDEILAEVKKLEGQQKEIKKEIFKLSWYMRGGMTITEAFGLCQEDREIISDLVKENLEVTKKSGLSFF